VQCGEKILTQTLQGCPVATPSSPAAWEMREWHSETLLLCCSETWDFYPTAACPDQQPLEALADLAHRHRSDWTAAEPLETFPLPPSYPPFHVYRGSRMMLAGSCSLTQRADTRATRSPEIALSQTTSHSHVVRCRTATSIWGVLCWGCFRPRTTRVRTELKLKRPMRTRLRQSNQHQSEIMRMKNP
jgi:hypothetical protein